MRSNIFYNNAMFVRVVGNIKYTVVSHCSTLVTNLNVYKIEIKSNEVFNFIVPAFGVQFPVTACLIQKYAQSI